MIKVLASAHPDAIQLTRGQAPLLQGISGKEKPALVLRADVANIYGNPMDSYLFSTHFPDAVIEAVRLDACCVVETCSTWRGGRRCASAVSRRSGAPLDCTRFGVPLMVEPLVMLERTGG